MSYVTWSRAKLSVTIGRVRHNYVSKVVNQLKTSLEYIRERVPYKKHEHGYFGVKRKGKHSQIKNKNDMLSPFNLNILQLFYCLEFRIPLTVPLLISDILSREYIVNIVWEYISVMWCQWICVYLLWIINMCIFLCINIILNTIKNNIRLPWKFVRISAA